MAIGIGDDTRVINRIGDTVGRARIIFFDRDQQNFLVEWIDPRSKQGQREEVAYWRLLDIHRR